MASTRRRRRYRSVVYLILAMIVFLSPVVLTHYKNVEQQRIAQQYSESIARLTDEQRQQQLEAAREYNRNLPTFGSPDPWVNGVDTASPGYKAYLDQLNSVDTMARIKVPAVGIDLPVYHGTSTDTLGHGIGHLYGTGLPVGGEGTHSVLTGHTGLATLTMFDNLTHIKMGDVFVVEVMGEQLAYKVDSIKTVLPEDVESIRPEEGRDLVTLVTCTPYGINSHRLLVTGERTELPGHIDQEYHSPWQPWMVASIVISVLVLIYLLWLAWRRHKKNKNSEKH